MHDDPNDTLTQMISPFASVPEELTLVVVTGPEQGRCYAVPASGAIIGRSPEADIVVPDPGVSRLHAAIEPAVGLDEFVVRDLGSVNGLHINGRRVDRHRLVDGDRVQLSDGTVLRVRLQAPAETEMLQEMVRAATRDALTGVANRAYLETRLQQEFAFAHRHRVPLSLLMLDLDHFKQVNDTYGHAAGDAVLRAVGALLRTCTRVEDVVARYGGEEFVIISRGYPLDSARLFAERLREALRRHPIDIGPKRIRVTVSIGVASFQPGRFEFDDRSKLLVRADAALYQSKRAGRDLVSCWDGNQTPHPHFAGEITVRRPGGPLVDSDA